MRRMFSEKQIEKMIEEKSPRLYRHKIAFSTNDVIYLIDNSEEEVAEDKLPTRVSRAITSYVASSEYNEGILLSFFYLGTGDYSITYYDSEEGIFTLELENASFEDFVSPY